MGCPSEVEIGDNLTFSVTTHDPDTGVLTDADAVPDYWVYEDETGVSINANTPDADVMAKLDDAHTTGLYSETLACTAGNGYENGKTYTIYVEATVDSDKGGICYSFKASNARTTLDTLIRDVPTVAEFEARSIAAADYFDPAADTVALVTDITTKTGFALSTAGADAIWDRTGALLSISYETMIERLYMERMHKEIITNSTGAVALRNAGDSGDIATGNISDNSTLTTRTALSF